RADRARLQGPARQQRDGLHHHDRQPAGLRRRPGDRAGHGPQPLPPPDGLRALRGDRARRLQDPLRQEPLSVRTVRPPGRAHLQGRCRRHGPRDRGDGLPGAAQLPDRMGRNGRGGRTRMTREDYDRYVAAFNARDYDAVFDFYAENPRMAFFGIEITTREQLRDFYTFLHAHVHETVTVERFASSEELAAVEALVRI